MVSLQDQLLKAGLVDKNKAKKAQQDKSKQQKLDRRAGVETVNESQAAAQEAQRQNAEKARQANAERDAAAAQKALYAQIRDLVQKNRQSKGKGKLEVAYNYTFGTKIERIYVSEEVQEHLRAGRLAIICLDGAVELVPRVIAEKIAERDAAIVVQVKKASNEVEEDDPYAEFQIPDDFTW